ncbi:hypothetical protein [Erythrobacter rubeus]|uniref:XRE family transcriptional regulator n=1 Tax=Erythrobacter rubeus TaxID=2760803 RepID=A0ABR8KRW2_9SPHN|nr:hypothetical protein [Erythrobacter rubeus]MBD2842684.1 hypothetical protein [Erythrobacter rubeus]
MSSNLASQQNLANRFANVLRRFEHEGGCIDALAGSVGETSRDLRRWADGTKMPAHVFSALLGELPRHLADEMVRPTGLKLIDRDCADSANALSVAAQASALAADIAERHADGRFCHRDAAAVRDLLQRILPDFENLASGGAE